MLLHMIAHLTGLEARELIISIGNAHLYKNQIEQTKEQITRKPFPLPRLKIVGNPQSIDDFTAEHFVLEDYEAHPHIKASLVVL